MSVCVIVCNVTIHACNSVSMYIALLVVSSQKCMKSVIQDMLLLVKGYLLFWYQIVLISSNHNLSQI